jgi:hypothetical protein
VGRFLRSESAKNDPQINGKYHDDVSEQWWNHLGSDDEFEQEIIQRMGKTFYHDVFQPAVQRAWDAEQSYEDIRDTLRTEWNAQH